MQFNLSPSTAATIAADAPNLRQLVVRKLGSRCAECGWAEDDRVLAVVRKDGEGTTDARKHQSREKFFMKVLTTLEEWELLCANHRFIRMYDHCSRKGKPAARVELPVQPGVFVWRPDGLKVEEVLGARHPWLEAELATGREVVIVLPGGVFAYPGERRLAEDWREYADARGLAALPDGATTGVVERRMA